MFIAALFTIAKMWNNLRIHWWVNGWGRYTCTHTHGILLSHTEEWNLAICDNLDGPSVYYAKWNKPDRKEQILYDFTYMWNQKQTNKIKQNQVHRYREQISGYQRGGGLVAKWVKRVKYTVKDDN